MVAQSNQLCRIYLPQAGDELTTDRHRTKNYEQHQNHHLANLSRGRRRRMVLAALVMGGLFLLLYGLGVALIDQNLQHEQISAIQLRFSYNLLLIAGLYVVHFLTVMLAIFASVDTIAGEIASHTIQTLVTKPVRRWQIVLGKWLGYAAMLLLYLGLLGGGIFLVMYLLVGYMPPNPLARPAAADARGAGAALALDAGRDAPLDADQWRAAVYAVRRGVYRRVGRADRRAAAIARRRQRRDRHQPADAGRGAVAARILS